METYEGFRNLILGMSGLVILAIICAFLISQATWQRKSEFIDRLIKSPRDKVHVQFQHFPAEGDLGTYMETVLYTRIEGDSQEERFENDSQIEWVCERLIRAGVAIHNPGQVVQEIRTRIERETAGHGKTGQKNG